MVVVDAGCGWGRTGQALVWFVDAGNYFGLDADEFSLRAFVQIELALRSPRLALAKRPRFLRSPAFDFAPLLPRGRAADFVLFASVLKESFMPIALREAALRRAACALAPRGTIVVWMNCEGTLRGAARRLGLEVGSRRADLSNLSDD